VTARRCMISPAMLLAGLALAICACSSGQSAPGVASLPSSSHSATTLTKAQQFQRLVQFAECMRSHGIDVPDPQGISFQIPVATDPATAAALRACQHWLPSLSSGGGITPNADLVAELPHLIAYARCMRAHDIAMLDPNSFGVLNLGPVPGINNDFGRNSPQFRSADTACRVLLPAGVHDDGTGP
jgi:hypothetical protein